MTTDKDLVLICNSHIDPVWLWPWEEGLSVTLSTFRAAATLCEEFDDFVFCHNEALLYSWIEQWDPALFQRIQRLVKRGRWHIMGGWFLQPDCNLPSGESFVRQVLAGRQYFSQKFGVAPTVAINFDPFGHTRGLVQILAKSGYTGYLFCRPDAKWLDLPSDDFTWVGYDGSTVTAHRAADHYNSELGKARVKIERWLSGHADRHHGLLLWGVGNHGGGASRHDLREIAELVRSVAGERSITHGRPEDYFARVGAGSTLPRVERSLNPWAVGCYTSMATVKQAHARLERTYFAAETISAAAATLGLLTYPRRDLRAALEDLLYCQFHDILPGEGIQEVEQQALDRLGHGNEIAGRVRARAFFALLAGQPAAAEGEYPICAYNHHPYPADEEIVCEFQPPEPNFDRAVFWQPRLTGPDGHDVAVQLEKESCNIQNDQRKRLVFRASLPPSTLTRFSCRLDAVPVPPPTGVRDVASPLTLTSGRRRVTIDPATGLLSSFKVDGVEYLAAQGPRPVVMNDSDDPWGMKVRSFREVAGHLSLMDAASAARFAGVSAGTLPPVRIIEEGPVRVVVEALLHSDRAAVCLRYKVPTQGSAVEIEALVSWRERHRMLKLGFPSALAQPRVTAQVPYGVEEFAGEGEECVGHRWIALTDQARHATLTVITESTYGFDVADGELRLSLLRAPAYAGHPVDDTTPIVRQDRFEPREDEGLHRFRFWLDAGPTDERLALIDSEATRRTSPPMVLNVFPSGDGIRPLQGVVVDDPAIRLGALKLAEEDGRLVIRLFETTGTNRRVRFRIPALALDRALSFGPFELKTLAVDPDGHQVAETDLLERPIRGDA